MTVPIPDPAGIPKPPDEFKDWLDCALFAADSQPYEYGAPQVQKDQMQAVVKNARAELQALRGRVAELTVLLALAERIVVKINGPLQSTLHWEAGKWLTELDKKVKTDELDSALKGGSR